MSRRTRLKLTFVGGQDSGKTSLIYAMANGHFPGRFHPTLLDPHVIDLEFDPSSYQPKCQGVAEMDESRTRWRIDGMAKKQQTFELQLCDTFTSEGHGPLRAMDAAVIAICFSVADREAFDMIKTKWYPEIRHFSPHAQLVIVGTMTDRRLRFITEGRFMLIFHSESPDIVSFDEGRRLAEELHASYVECSTKVDSQSVDDVLKTMLWRWYKFSDQKKTRNGLDGCILQ